MTSDTTPTQIPNGIPVHRARRTKRVAVFHQRDVTRAVKGVQVAGLEVGGVRVEPDGTILVIPGTPTAMPSYEPNEWDE